MDEMDGTSEGGREVGGMDRRNCVLIETKDSFDQHVEHIPSDRFTEILHSPFEENVE